MGLNLQWKLDQSGISFNYLLTNKVCHETLLKLSGRENNFRHRHHQRQWACHCYCKNLIFSPSYRRVHQISQTRAGVRVICFQEKHADLWTYWHDRTLSTKVSIFSALINGASYRQTRSVHIYDHWEARFWVIGQQFFFRLCLAHHLVRIEY